MPGCVLGSREGVVKFVAHHRSCGLDLARHGELAARLLAWREVLARLGLVGQEATRYGGAAYGNVSARIGPPGAPRGRRAFLVTGTGTAGLACADADILCVVESYDAERNQVESHGPTPPSSESLTHGALYDLGAHVRWVLHAHEPLLWRERAALRLPTTPPDVEYGTPAMARAVAALWRGSSLADRGILAMAGHEDGIVVCGRSAEEAGAVLVRHVAAAFERACARSGSLCRD